MKKKDFIIKNITNFNSIYNKNKKKLSLKFEKIFSEIKKDLANNGTLSVLNKKYKFNFDFKDLKKFKKFRSIAIIGMGGSILGSEAIYGFLKKKIKKKVYFFNNINEEQITNFKKKEKINNVLYVIVSKSGNTIETLSNAFLLKILRKDAKNIIIISERGNNSLFNLAKKLNIFYVEHKKKIGGRYSVLSEVGIIPAYLMGINTFILRSKLLDCLKGVGKKQLKESSIVLSTLLKSKRYNNLVFLNYSEDTEKLLFWCQQLIAESLGKKGMGFFPMISNVPKDHHSLLQLYLDGPKDKIFYIFYNDKKSNIKVDFTNLKVKENFLNKKSLGIIKKAQKDALMKVLKIINIPIKEFYVTKNDEATLGKIFSYFILETIIVGKLTNINPFDQPAVERVKIFTKKLLN